MLSSPIKRVREIVHEIARKKPINDPASWFGQDDDNDLETQIRFDIIQIEDILKQNISHMTEIVTEAEHLKTSALAGELNYAALGNLRLKLQKEVRSVKIRMSNDTLSSLKSILLERNNIPKHIWEGLTTDLQKYEETEAYVETGTIVDSGAHIIEKFWNYMEEQEKQSHELSREVKTTLTSTTTNTPKMLLGAAKNLWTNTVIEARAWPQVIGNLTAKLESCNQNSAKLDGSSLISEEEIQRRVTYMIMTYTPQALRDQLDTNNLLNVHVGGDAKALRRHQIKNSWESMSCHSDAAMLYRLFTSKTEEELRVQTTKAVEAGKRWVIDMYDSLEENTQRAAKILIKKLTERTVPLVVLIKGVEHSQCAIFYRDGKDEWEVEHVESVANGGWAQCWCNENWCVERLDEEPTESENFTRLRLEDLYPVREIRSKGKKKKIENEKSQFLPGQWIKNITQWSAREFIGTETEERNIGALECIITMSIGELRPLTEIQEELIERVNSNLNAFRGKTEEAEMKK